MKEIIRYRCDHCNKVFANKSYTLKHEEVCYWNPKTKSCITCEHFTTELYNPKTRICYEGLNITKKLKTNCIYYKEREEY
jgi:hypothetical protein